MNSKPSLEKPTGTSNDLFRVSLTASHGDCDQCIASYGKCRCRTLPCDFCGEHFCVNHYPPRLIQNFRKLEPKPEYEGKELPSDRKEGHKCLQFDQLWHETWTTNIGSRLISEQQMDAMIKKLSEQKHIEAPLLTTAFDDQKFRKNLEALQPKAHGGSKKCRFCGKYASIEWHFNGGCYPICEDCEQRNRHLAPPLVHYLFLFVWLVALAFVGLFLLVTIIANIPLSGKAIIVVILLIIAGLLWSMKQKYS